MIRSHRGCFSWSTLVLAVLAVFVFRTGAALTPEQRKQLPPPTTAQVDFARDIKPILDASCAKCHGRGKNKGGFRLDTRETFLQGGDSGPVAEAGHSAESLLIALVSGLDPDNVMPVKGSKLTAAQVALLRSWIDQGMPWSEGISFAKPAPLNLRPRQPQLPPAGRGVEHPVDRLLAAYLAEHRVKAGPLVEDRIYARRVYLDVLGVLPKVKELEEFVQDRRADKRERLVDRLLGDSRRYAENWLTFWNDLLRNDYRGTGYIDGGREQISSWLYAALYTNMSYDRFVAELIDPTPKSAGFTKGIVWRGTVNASQIPPMQAAQNISQVFMGVNLKCASCHDSFINDWALTDAYSLANVYADKPLEIFQCDKPTGKQSGIAFIYPELGEIPAGLGKVERTKRLAEIVVQPRNGRLTRTVVNRLWARFMGRGLVEPADDMEQVAWNQDLLDWLAEDLAAHGYNLKHTIKLILTSRAYQWPAVSLDEQTHTDYVFHGPSIRRLTAEQFRDALGALTGVWYSEPAKGITLVVPGTPETKAYAPPDSVRWIWSEAAAATRTPPATVFFQKSIVLAQAPTDAWAVAACDNSYTLYINGTKAGSGKNFSEPNLINIRPQLKAGTNWIAVAAVNHTPEDKALAAGQAPREGDENPAGFIFLSRLQVGGQLLQIGSDQSWLFSKAPGEGWEKAATQWSNGASAFELGPAKMTPWDSGERLAATLAMSHVHKEVRSSLVAADPLMLALGRPNREQVISTRASAATTLQALELTNGDTLANVLNQGAEKVLAEKAGSSRELVSRLYEQAIGRKPSAAEARLAGELLGPSAGKEQVEDLLWVMAMLPEFQLIY